MQATLHQQANLLSLPEHEVNALCRGWLRKDPLFLDTETTGLDENAEIVELAVVNCEGETLINTLIKPSVPIPATVTALHGIDDAMVADAPDWHDVYQEVCSLLAGRYVFAYNAKFDARMLEQTCGI